MNKRQRKKQIARELRVGERAYRTIDVKGVHWISGGDWADITPITFPCFVAYYDLGTVMRQGGEVIPV